MKEIFIDQADLNLLRVLQLDASQTNQALAESCNMSAPTCMRRVRRLRDCGIIEPEKAVLNVEKISSWLGHGLCAIVEVTLDKQDQGSIDAFEETAILEEMVQQCYRVSPGPDFCLVVHCNDMPSYLHLTQRLFTNNTNVRNVKTYFSIKRSKFGAALPLPTKLKPI